VGGFEGVGDLFRDGEGFVEWDRAFGDAVGQSWAIDQLHHQVVRADVEQGADIRMIQGGDGFGFALEAIGELFGREFDRDFAVQSGIARLPDFAHATAADALDQAIRTELLHRRQGIPQEYYETQIGPVTLLCWLGLR
jgi:hypothetical protein